jgi:hypothetical protein
MTFFASSVVFESGQACGDLRSKGGLMLIFLAVSVIGPKRSIQLGIIGKALI